MHLPDSTLDQISKLARTFLWSNGSNVRCFHSIGWSVTTLKKSEGGLGLRNLRLVRHSLMAKNIFAILNSDSKIWVDIFNHKYSNWHPWSVVSPSKSSWFFKSISRSAQCLKMHLRILRANPNDLDLLRDPCLLDLPILFKPTYLNMDFNFDNLHFSGLFLVDGINTPLFHNIFGHNIDWDWINTIRFDLNSHNHWVWGPSSHFSSVAAAVYDCLISFDISPWSGWNCIWKLCILPRTKTFIWKLGHGKLPSGDYLYNLNIGPPSLCPFCGLAPETASHIIWNCCKIYPIWEFLCATFNLDPIIISGFCSSNWLTSRISSMFSNDFFKALIATIAWIIWKDRCNLIFKNWQPKFHTIYSRAWRLCQDFFKSVGKDFREFSYPSLSFSSWRSINLFTDASWSSSSVSCGLGFIATALAKSCLQDLWVAARILHFLLRLRLSILRLTIASLKTGFLIEFSVIAQVSLAYSNTSTAVWRGAFNLAIDSLKIKLLNFPCSDFKSIPRSDNLIADALANFGRSNPHLSLFDQGLDRPRWLEDLCRSLHFFF
ncbi:uncharacterized protein LOC120281070 [Dioscorea cayenensis subsp. rotundata]|uniref:Uncharacterized protein LOC120281070 n=1 Tax=Dioscorea cayennensis subsp. rotundata TaxID=55577 RepID=A0AB40CZH3_DIOCR|nr:uncharacterized protein LOC120281070 [Dioscorea cayenensis subsp. rotundata]